MRKFIILSLIASILNSCTKVEYQLEQQSISKLENRVSCLGLPFNEFNVGEMHNEYVILLYNDIHVEMTPKIIEEKLKLNYLNLSAGLYANDLQKTWVDSLTFSLIEELSSKSFDFSQANGIVFDSIRNTEIFPYFIEVISAIEGMTSLSDLNERLDLILVAAANNDVDCVGYDALLGSIQITKSSAILWSPLEQGGLGFYEEIYGAQNEKAIPEWLKRTVKADASSSMTYMLGVGIAGAISSAAIPPTGAIFLGGWALSTGLGSAVGAAGI